MGQDSVLIVDVDNLAYRAYFRTVDKDKKPLISFNGQPTNLLSTWPGMIAKLTRELQIDLVILCLDNPSRFRKELYPDYKANRKDKPPEILHQLPILRDLIRHSGLPYIEDPFEEADDLVSSAALALKATHACYIASSDKDFNQILESNQVRQAKPMPFGQGWQLWTVVDALTQNGVFADQYAHFSAMVKDAADNIPGIEGIGPVTAAKLLQGRPSDEELVRRIAAKRKMDLRTARAAFHLNYQLTKARNLPVKTQRQAFDAGRILRSHGCLKAAEIMETLHATYGSKACPI